MALVSRLQNRIEIENRNPLYDRFRYDRNLTKIKHFDTQQLKFPTKEEMKTLTIITKPWAVGDRYEKLAAQYYKDPEMWWVIAAFNRKPAEFLLNNGDIVSIPLPLEYVLDYMGF
tara:strand:+ start:124 stop:468 length:345 start_codon:yes stop_codon:yes gene_type:complete